MKYKKGKGRKVRRQQKVYKFKKGGSKFTFSAKSSNWGSQSIANVMGTSNERVKDMLRRKKH